MRELDAARQAESDLVDRLFQNDHLILDTQHDALEDAVCGVAPRIFRVSALLTLRSELPYFPLCLRELTKSLALLPCRHKAPARILHPQTVA